MKNITYTFLVFVLLQISCKKKEDLSSFVKMNDKIEASNDIRSIKNESLLEIIFLNAEKNDELFPQKKAAERVHEISNNFSKYLSDLKTVIKEKNTTEFVDELFFNGEDISEEGIEFLNYIENYKSSLIATVEASNPEIVGIVKSNFDIGSIKDRRGQQTNWLTLNYRGFPPTSSIIKLSEMQADVKSIETKFYSSLIGVKLKETNDLERLKNRDKKIAKVENDNTFESEEKTVENTKETETAKRASQEAAKKEAAAKEEAVKKAAAKKEKPKKIVKEPKKKEAEKKSNTSDSNIHRVKKGETIYSIANKYNLTTVQLKKMNGMTNNNLVIGQKLRIRK